MTTIRQRITTRDRLLIAGTLQNEHVPCGLYLADKIADALEAMWAERALGTRRQFDAEELHADELAAERLDTHGSLR